MQAMPHHYRVSAEGGAEGLIDLDSPGLDRLKTDAPGEFGGSGDYWSPETLLVGAVANCFILTFRALARQSGLAWSGLTVSADGCLDHAGNGLRFTHFGIVARLRLGDGDEGTARQLLEKAEQHCLITNSLSAESDLRAETEQA